MNGHQQTLLKNIVALARTIADTCDDDYGYAPLPAMSEDDADVLQNHLPKGVYFEQAELMVRIR